eukprot:TRINITY_DN1619_c1_g1_i1.p1 TRINITY_DN1619_c1_g1~~TRINITY_DN1619_c1_g1_i1.p1  ORF type:complete len:236 (-),score=64.52 TRINITY_DN1619_c1_g1_i1:31-738(-)
MEVDGYALATLDDIEVFRSDCFDDGDDWAIVFDKGGITVDSKKFEGATTKAIRIFTRYEGISAELLYDVLHDPDYRKTWDDNMIDGHDIVKLDPYNDIGYYAAKFPFPLSNRDFLNQRSWWINEDRTEFMIFNHSVEHEECPPTSKFVRGWSFRTGYHIRVCEDDPESCELRYIGNGDPKGAIPNWLANKATQVMAPNIAKKLEEVARGYTEWKAANNPEKRPWISDEPYWWDRQ